MTEEQRKPTSEELEQWRQAKYGYVSGQLERTTELGAQKARWAAVVGAVAGFLLPGATYLLTVDGNGITGVEWLHAALLSIAGAAAVAGTVGGTVYAVQNKPKELPDVRDAA